MAGGFSSEVAAESFAPLSDGLLAEFSGGFSASFAALGSGWIEGFTGGAVAAVALAGGMFAAGTLSVDAAAGRLVVSGAGWAEGCPPAATGGLEGLVEEAGGLALGSVVSEVCSADDGLFECTPSHPKP